MRVVTTDELKRAYNKYKTYLYYDTSELFQRARLAEYETADLDSKLDSLSQKINTYTESDVNLKNSDDYEEQKNEKVIESFGKIDMHYLPKSFIEPEEIQKSNFITNRRVLNAYEVEKVLVIADLSVEWHLTTVLWIMRYGYLLDGMLADECRGNRLHLDKKTKKLKEGGTLFKPYFKQYRQWRDDAVEVAQRRLNRGKHMAFVNLDIKDFFYSAAIDFEQLEKDIRKRLKEVDSPNAEGFESCKVHKLFKRLHEIYFDKLEEHKYPYVYPDNYNDKCVLPIGLTSSYILANYFLADFDRRVKNLIPNVYYGRYVDDILVVIEDPDINFNEDEECEDVKIKIEEELSKGNQFIAEWFHKVLDLKSKPDYIKKAEKTSDNAAVSKEKDKSFFRLRCYDNCYIQPSKTLVYYFDKDESTAVIDKLKYDLDVRASEFRDFPIEGEDLSTFDDSAYHLIFDDSEGKIRTLKDYKENRLGLSVFLANRIFAALRRTEVTDEAESQRVVKIFRGITALTYFRMWEKVFTFLVMNKQQELFVEFYEHVKREIGKLSLTSKRQKTKDKSKRILNSKISNTDVEESLKEYLNIAVQMALSLNSEFIQEEDKVTVKYSTADSDMDSSKKKFDFRSSYLVRHHYTVHPLVTLAENNSKLADWTSSDISLLSEVGTIPHPIIDTYKIPRKVKFWECCIAQVNEAIMKIDHKLSEGYDTKGVEGVEGVEMLDAALDKYIAINKLYFLHDKKKEKIKKQFYSTSTKRGCNSCYDVDICEFKIGDEERDKTKMLNPQIAIANTRISEKNIISGIRGKVEIDTSRYNTLAKILKETRASKSDFLVMPECSVPVTLLPSLARHSADNNIAIVTGLEHWNVNGVVYNFIVTILPVTVDYAKDAVVMYRLKNHYSPDERLLIKGHSYHIPTRVPNKYYIINWQGIYFAPFYCFELANALHRSLFKSKIDLMIISELNRDIPYYDNIVGATSRDLHCYVAQVNTSQYGDSRLTQPTMSETKDIMKLKGGLNDTILTERINIDALREFQLISYELAASKGDKSFKPLPPDWDRDLVEKRISGGFVTEVAVPKSGAKGEVTDDVFEKDTGKKQE